MKWITSLITLSLTFLCFTTQSYAAAKRVSSVTTTLFEKVDDFAKFSKGPKVLVVEDDMMAQFTLRSMLPKAAESIEAADDVNIGILITGNKDDAVRAIDGGVHCMICDNQIETSATDKAIVSALEDLYEQANTRDIPFYSISGSEPDKFSANLRDYLTNNRTYIGKPATTKKLKPALEAAIKKHSGN